MHHRGRVEGWLAVIVARIPTKILQIRVLLDLQNNFFVRIAILPLNETCAQGQLKRLSHIAGSRRKQARILCFDFVPRKELCLLHPAVFFPQTHAHWLLKIRQTDLPFAVLIHTRSLQVQGFCLLFAVSLALIIAQIGGNVLCCNAFWVGQ